MDDRIDEESDAEFAAEKLDSMYNTELFSFDIKKLAGFGKGGEKGFEGTMTQLQMQTYLCACDFRKRLNKKGAEYGWNVAVYSMPEKLWGYDHVTSAYGESPEESWERIVKHMDDIYPIATEKQRRCTENSNSKLYIKSLHITLHISLHMCLHMLFLYASQVIKNNMMHT